MSCVKHIWKLKDLKLSSTKSLAVSQVTFTLNSVLKIFNSSPEMIGNFTKSLLKYEKHVLSPALLHNSW